VHFRRFIALRLSLLLLFGADLVIVSSFHTLNASTESTVVAKTASEPLCNVGMLMEEVSPEERDRKSHSDLLVIELQSLYINANAPHIPLTFLHYSGGKTGQHLYTLFRALLI
jgi:hypothetical protein